MSRFTLIVPDQGGPVELSGEKAIRRAIQSGLLRRDTWVTVVEGDSASRLVAGDAAGMPELFDELLGGSSGKSDAEATAAEDNRANAQEEIEDAQEELGSALAGDAAGQEEADATGAASDAARITDEAKAESKTDATDKVDKAWAPPSRTSQKEPNPAVLIGGGLALLALIAIAVASQDRGGSSNDYGPSTQIELRDEEPTLPALETSSTLFASRSITVRRSAGRDGVLLGDLPRGTELVGLFRTNSEGEVWLQLTEGLHSGGFVWVGNLRDTPRPHITAIDRDFWVDGSAQVYREPHEASGYLGAPALVNGESVRVVGETTDGWSEIQVEGFGVGYVRSSALYEAPHAEYEEDSAPAPQCSTYNERVYCFENGAWRDTGPAAPAAPARQQPVTPPPTATRSPVPGPGPTQAPPPQPQPLERPSTEVREATITRVPTPEQVSRGYPSRAQDRGVEGQSTMRCLVSMEGRLEACRVTSETPAGYGFGQAAVRLAREFRALPRRQGGRSVPGGTVDVTVNWVLED